MSDPDGDKDMASASSGSESDDDIDNDAITIEIEKLKEGLKDNPYDYDKYKELIELLSKAGELDELRDIRKRFAEYFPLPSEIWLAWLADESKLATTNEEKVAVGELFDKAVKDYVSIEIWLEYCQFSLWQLALPDGLKDIRAIHERALVAAGIHGSKGALIWDAYREFENCILSQNPSNEEQRARVDKLFRRQLAVPLMGKSICFYRGCSHFK